MAKDIVYVYGTLRPGLKETRTIKGTMFDLGAFPGVKLDGDGVVVVEKITTEKLKAFDLYEGFDERHPDTSLYLRVPFEDGWIYVINGPVRGAPVVENGDWLLHKNLKEGRAYGRFA